MAEAGPASFPSAAAGPSAAGQLFVGNVSHQLVRRRVGPVAPGDLVFNAHFESGNLGRVDQLDDVEYELTIRHDTQNSRQSIWFFFSVRNVARGQRVLFTFTNYSKAKSLFKSGMTPVVSSTSRPGWQRIPPQNLFYYKVKKTTRFTLAFVFDREEDTYFFAYSFPYTYSRLQSYLASLDECGHLYYQRSLLGHSEQQRRLDLVSVGDPAARSVVFLSARIHPGETPASLVCQGLIDHLLGTSREAEYLRARALFKIVPMLNPDGVYHGNYRCSTLGHDLNRCWAHAQDFLHPTLMRTRQALVETLQDPGHQLDFYIDLHAHSSNYNAFMYGNLFDDPAKNEKQWVLPRLLASETALFSLEQTLFNNDKQKAGTGRRSLGGILGDAVCYTLEVSFFALRSASGGHVTPLVEQDYLDLGRSLCRAIARYYQGQR